MEPKSESKFESPLLENALLNILNVYTGRIVRAMADDSFDEFDVQEEIFSARKEAVEEIKNFSEGIIEWKEIKKKSFVGKSKAPDSSDIIQTGAKPNSSSDTTAVFDTEEFDPFGNPSQPATSL